MDAADSVLHGDLLEHVLLRVPHDELAASPALVSREWRRAARAAHERHRRRHLPCYLVAHVHGGAAVGRSTHVYDPRRREWASDGWRRVDARALPLRRCVCCAGAGGDRVYALSLTSMAVSEDALGDGDGAATAAWCELPPPRVWRVDPVVAVVGPRFVVLGGGCGAAAAAGVVEVLDDDEGWTTCAPIPAPLAASRRVSAAASWRRVYVVERRTGWASWFDPAARQWGLSRRLQLPEGVDVESWAACGATTSSGIGGGDASERLLVLAGGGSGGVVSLWSVDGDTLVVDGEANANANASMPREMSERLSLGAAGGGDIGVAAGGAASGYVYNASEPSKGAVRYELVDSSSSSRKYRYDEKTCGGGSRWEWEWLPFPPAAAAAMSSSSAVVVVFACSRSSSAANK